MLRKPSRSREKAEWALEEKDAPTQEAKLKPNQASCL